jgi:hypothetical protein
VHDADQRQHLPLRVQVHQLASAPGILLLRAGAWWVSPGCAGGGGAGRQEGEQGGSAAAGSAGPAAAGWGRRAHAPAGT